MKFLKQLKKVDKSIITVCGGGIITGDPIPAIKALQYADYDIIGEGEISTCELCDAIIKMRSMGKSKALFLGIIHIRNTVLILH